MNSTKSIPVPWLVNVGVKLVVGDNLINPLDGTLLSPDQAAIDLFNQGNVGVKHWHVLGFVPRHNSMRRPIAVPFTEGHGDWMPNFKALYELCPSVCTQWAHHSATLSGAFKLLEEVQGVKNACSYQLFAKRGDMGVYLNGVLVMHRREDGMFRIANRGESLT